MEPLTNEPDAETSGTESYVVFQLAGESYALAVARVHEVLDATALTQVPGSPKALRGLFNLRGHVVPVWSLRATFQLSEDDPGGSSAVTPCVLMVEAGSGQAPAGRVAGLLVDRVSDVLESPPEDLQAAPSLGLGGGSAFVSGLIRHQDRFLLVLDLDRVLAALAQGQVPEES